MVRALIFLIAVSLHAQTLLPSPISGSGGGGPFNTISSGTNTTAAMVCGTGCSITPSGTGTITATSLNGVMSSALNPFIKLQANPIISPAAGEDITAFGSFLKVGSTYHAYYQYNISSVAAIGHATSTDGFTWTKDSGNNPVLSAPGGSVWDGTGVGTPTVWKEGATWYMLYRGYGTFDANSRAGLATSTDGLTWTRAAVNNCTGETGNGCVIDIGMVGGGTESIEPFGLIKVGSTYYLNIDEPGGAARTTGIATSTNLTTWTKDPANPLYTGGRYCAGIVKSGSYYYQLIAHYLGGATTYSDVELYRNSTPVFYSTTRTFMGIAIQPSSASATSPSRYDGFGLDTPFVLTDDINRDTFTASNGDLWLYYSGSNTANHANFFTSVAISGSPASWGQASTSYAPNGITVIGTVEATGDVKAGGANGFWLTNADGYVFWQGRSEINSLTNGTLLFRNSSENAGVTLDFTTDSVLSIKNRANNASAAIGVSRASYAATLFANLATAAPTNGDTVYCSDCTVTSGSDDTCAGSGTGADVMRLNGVYRCRI
jgi:hypothetical protein